MSASSFTSLNMQAEVPSWGPTTAVWTEKSKLDYEELQERFRTADLDGCAGHKAVPLACMRIIVHAGCERPLLCAGMAL